MKALILTAVCAAALMVGAADETKNEIKMTAYLVDGSTVVGTPKFDGLQTKLAFANVQIPVHLISAIAFTSNAVKVVFSNDDALTGVPQFGALAVKTSFGDVNLAQTNLRSVVFMNRANPLITSSRLPDNELSRCLGLIRNRFYAVWDQPSWSENLKPTILEIHFGAGGRVIGSKVVTSSGDREVDDSVRRAAARVDSVSGLTTEFLAQYPTLQIAFEVTPQ